MAIKLTISAAFILLVLGLANTFLILEAMGGKGARVHLRSWHRGLGYLFFVLFLVVSLYMIPRLAYLENTPVTFIIHGLAAIVILSLLIAKLVIVRRYKLYMSSAPVIGLYLMTGTVLIVASGAGVALLKLILGVK